MIFALATNSFILIELNSPSQILVIASKLNFSQLSGYHTTKQI